MKFTPIAGQSMLGNSMLVFEIAELAIIEMIIMTHRLVAVVESWYPPCTGRTLVLRLTCTSNYGLHSNLTI